ncbi:MAG: pilus biosynthesis protein PilC [Rariglobus sp.]|jgi:type IV pilus assembly protein PilC|nr:pilus biosynthesis protein PilC [Rariglobus sp.]
MPKFTYSAIESASGKEKKGVVESTSSEQAAAELKAMGLIPTALAPEGGAGATKLSTGAKKDVRKLNSPSAPADMPLRSKKKKGSITFGRVINNAGLTVFTRQLATLVNAGMPIMRSLETLARQEKNLPFKEVVESLVESIRSGSNFSDGLLQHPKVFDRLYVNMVKAGEAGGVLGTVLERLSRFMEKAEKIKGKVKSAMTYPVIIVFVAVGIVGALMIFVIPQFEKIFSGMLKGKAMPGLTLAVLSVSNFIKDHYLITIGIIVVGYFAFKAWHKTRGGTRAVDWFLLHAPGVGPLFLKSSISRFTRTLGTLLASGVPILQALLITRDTSGNVHVADALNVVHDRVKEGDNVARPLDSTKVFPTMVTSMIEVGEETGALPEMLNRVADTYDDEVDNSVAGLTSIIEPVMIVFMAVMVGTIVIALFLPIIEIIKGLQ